MAIRKSTTVVLLYLIAFVVANRMYASGKHLSACLFLTVVFLALSGWLWHGSRL